LRGKARLAHVVSRAAAHAREIGTTRTDQPTNPTNQTTQPTKTIGPPPPFIHTQVEEAGAALQRLRKHEGLGITVIRGEELREKGFGGLYGVGKAAERPPALVVLSKAGSGEMVGRPPVVWVGKGIVYDTGGLSIKTKVMRGVCVGGGGGGPRGSIDCISLVVVWGFVCKTNPPQNNTSPHTHTHTHIHTHTQRRGCRA
jgi:leucyl aminopeptidase